MMPDYFRDSLKTDLAKSIYDWAPVYKPTIAPEIAKEIIAAFCTREQRKCLRIDLGAYYVVLDGEHSIELHSKWRASFWDHGYSAPVLVCKGEEEI
jgi:hypothetical protein